MKTLMELFVHELKDIYNAENQILRALPKMIKKATSDKLRKGLEKHLQETEGQVERLEQIAEELDISLTGEHCKGMEGLLKEGDDVINERNEENLEDAAIIGAAQKIEHYEISSYTTLIKQAELMDHKKAAKLLKQTLKEEENADKTLAKIAQGEVAKKVVLH